MIQQGISEIFEAASKIKSQASRVRYLQDRKLNQVMLMVLQMAFSDQIKFALPKGPTPYKPTQLVDLEGRLYGEVRRMYLFIEGGYGGKSNANISQTRREALWVQQLESMDVADAALMDAVKDGKVPYSGISPAVVRQAFPGLLPPEDKSKKKAGRKPGPVPKKAAEEAKKAVQKAVGKKASKPQSVEAPTT